MGGGQNHRYLLFMLFMAVPSDAYLESNQRWRSRPKSWRQIAFCQCFLQFSDASVKSQPSMTNRYSFESWLLAESSGREGSLLEIWGWVEEQDLAAWCMELWSFVQWMSGTPPCASTSRSTLWWADRITKLPCKTERNHFISPLSPLLATESQEDTQCQGEEEEELQRCHKPPSVLPSGFCLVQPVWMFVGTQSSATGSWRKWNVVRVMWWLGLITCPHQNEPQNTTERCSLQGPAMANHNSRAKCYLRNKDS